MTSVHVEVPVHRSGRTAAQSDSGFQVLQEAELARVCGGQGEDIPAFGRCGPADRYQWLFGNIETDECAEHARRVRDGLKAGKSKVEAHRDALPWLGPAVGSWFREKFKGR